MSLEKVAILDRSKMIAVTQFFALTGISTIAPFFHQQIVTGTIVNAILFVAVGILGVRAGLLIAFIPSLIALSTGTLPAILLPMIPFIMAGNAIMILIFNFLKNKNSWIAIILASFLKFLFLYSTSQALFLILGKGISKNILMMMSWPQLITALIGGSLAFLALGIYYSKAKTAQN